MKRVGHIICEFYFDCLLFLKKCKEVILETKIDHDFNALEMIFREVRFAQCGK